ncbi:MAG: PAS domain S-box protein [Deltaproteobacteria bacterium]|nr:PAS domain S-box protein [Deltaproteobacteria bacterium]
MPDRSRSKESLINELAQLRRRVTRLEQESAKLPDTPASQFDVLTTDQGPERRSEKGLPEPNKSKGNLLDKTTPTNQGEILRLLFSVIGDAIIILDSGGTIIDINTQGEELLRNDREDLIGLAVDSLLPPPLAIDHQVILQEVLRQGRPIHFGEQLYGRFYDQSFYPIWDDHSRMYFVALIIRDMSDYHLKEQVLHRNETRLHRLQREAQVGFWEKNLVTGQVFWSDEFYRLLGYEPGEVPARLDSLEGHLTPEDWTWFKTFYEDVIRSEQTVKLEARLRRKDGAWGYFDIQGGVEEGSEWLSGTLHDITERKLAEKALVESENRYRLVSDYNRSLIEASLDPLVTISAEGKITDVNKATEKVTGLSRSELIGTDFSIYFTEPERARAGYRQVFETGQVKDYSLEILAEDGRVTSVLYNASVYRDENNQVIGVFAAARDITAQKKAEEALRAGEEKYRTLFESESDAIFLIDADSGKILDINESAVRLYLYSREELTCLTINDLSAQQTMAGMLIREPLSHIPLRYHKKKDGTIFPVEITSNSLMLQGRRIIIAAIRNITERILSEELLRVSEERFAKVFMSSPSLMAVSTLDEGRFLDVNEAFIQAGGFTREEVIGKTSPDLNVWTENFPRDDFVRRVQNEGGVKNIDIQFRMKSGELREFMMSTELIEINRKPYLLTLGQDITERKQAEEKIKASLKEKEALIREIHHRVKNNLNVITGLLDLQCEYSNDDRISSILKECRDRVKSMALIHEKLYRSPNLAGIDLNGYINDLISTSFASYGIRSGKVKLETNMEDISIGIDTAVPCGLILNELITNCLKHAFPGDRQGTISIALRSLDDGRVELTVADDGVGLPANLDLNHTSSLGWELITGLTKHQLKGNLMVKQDPGTEVKIIFKKPS